MSILLTSLDAISGCDAEGCDLEAAWIVTIDHNPGDSHRFCRRHGNDFVNTTLRREYQNPQTQPRKSHP